MKIAHKQVILALNELSEELSEKFHRINWGGCGVVAGFIGKQLQRIGIEVEVVTSQSNGLTANDIRPLVKNVKSPWEWDRNGLSRNHCAIRFKLNGKLYTWDSDGLIANGDRFGSYGYKITHKFGLGMTPKEMSALGRSAFLWNDDFNRDQIKPIKNVIRSKISKLKEAMN